MTEPGRLETGEGSTFSSPVNLWPTGAVSVITRLWVLSVPLTVGIVLLAVLAWRGHYWGVAGRVHYTLVALGAVLFVSFLGNWNLIGL